MTWFRPPGMPPLWYVLAGAYSSHGPLGVALFGVQLLGQTLPRLLVLVQSPPFGSALLPGPR
ncbi:hypothetical protein ABZ471_30310 [Streptomyces sp. NPDC005728]|uniref:hypothetical protein n=1 Tax=Streptomyces sp. NPDC005728 TaxID=3157054 RepID=UPI0033D4769B